MITLREFIVGLIIAAALATSAFGQSNGKAAGGQTVPGVSLFCFTGATNTDGTLVVVPCQSTAGSAGYPAGATPVTNSATGTTGAVTATLPAAAGKTTYLCTVQIGEAGTGTATATATNTLGGTLNYVVTAPGNFTVTYTPCVPASAVNTTIPVSAAANASATAVAVTATGFQQ